MEEKGDIFTLYNFFLCVFNVCLWLFSHDEGRIQRKLSLKRISEYYSQKPL